MLRTDIWTEEGHTDGWSGPTPRPAFAKAKQFIIPGNPEIFFIFIIDHETPKGIWTAHEIAF